MSTELENILYIISCLNHEIACKSRCFGVYELYRDTNSFSVNYTYFKLHRYIFTEQDTEYLNDFLKAAYTLEYIGKEVESMNDTDALIYRLPIHKIDLLVTLFRCKGYNFKDMY